jgi:hypothetical protein
VDRPDNNTRTTDANKKALNMVLSMALVLVVTVSICVVIWRLASDHDFNTLGRYIATAGIVYISIGMMVIADRAQIKTGRSFQKEKRYGDWWVTLVRRCV